VIPIAQGTQVKRARLVASRHSKGRIVHRSIAIHHISLLHTFSLLISLAPTFSDRELRTRPQKLSSTAPQAADTCMILNVDSASAAGVKTCRQLIRRTSS
jgi:hypothetical protein